MRAEIIDLRQAFVIMLRRYDEQTLPRIDKLKQDFRAVLAKLPDFELGKIEALERRLNIMNEELKAIRNGMPVAEDSVKRLFDLEHRIINLEKRNPPGPSVRKRVGDIEEEIEGFSDRIREIRSSIENLENSHLIAHERLDKLEGDIGIDTEEQADNSKPTIVKGGWINVYAINEYGYPRLDLCDGPYSTQEEADKACPDYPRDHRFACLYLEGSGESNDEFLDPEPWKDEHDALPE